MKLEKPTYLLIIVLTFIVLIVESLTLSILYEVSFEQQRDQLIATVKSQARLMEAVARFDARFSQVDNSADAQGATLSQVHDAQKHFTGFGKTGELVLAKLEGKNIVFASHSRFSKTADKLLQNLVIPMGSSLAVPMQLALTGESGAIVASDYRGQVVLAAYEPVDVLNYGVIAKIDLSEVREPFVDVGAISVAVAFLLIIVGSIFFIRISKSMLKRVEDSETYNRMLFEYSPIGLALCRMDGSLMDINKAYADIVGRSVEETMTLTYWDITPEDYAEDEQRQLENLNTTGSYGPYEKEYIHKDGHRVPVSLLGQLIKKDDEELIWSSVEDISGRKQIEEASLLSEARLKEAQRIAKVGSWELNLLTNELIWSDEIFRIFEIDKNQFDASYEAFLNAIHPEDRDTVNKAYADSLINRLSYEIVHRLQMSDGRIKYVREICESQFDDSGKPTLSIGTVQDITELYNAELELQQFKTTLDQTLDCVFMFDAENLRFLYTNEGAIRQVGFSREELLTMHPYDIKPDISEAQFHELIAPLVSGEKASINFEAVHQHKNGQRLPVEIFLQYINDEPAHFVAIVRDISERKWNEAQLYSAMELNEKVINESPIGITIYEESGQCIAANESVSNIIGATHERVIAQNFRDIPSWKKFGLFDVAEAALESGERHRGEFEVTTSFGKLATYDCIFVPFFQYDKKHLMLMIDDISERKKAEEELESIFELSLDMVGAGNLDGYFTKINSSFKHILGYEKEEFLSKPFIEFMHKDDVEKTLATLSEAINGRDGLNVVNRYKCKDGSYKWVEWSVKAISQENVFYASGRDITERKQAEAELEKHRNHLEELVNERTLDLQNTQDELVRKERLATLGQLTATVSHELRNPLGAMKPSLYVIDKKSDKDDERIQQSIQRIDRNIDRCDHIIDELLDFTRITKLNRDVTRVNEWLESVIDEQNIPNGIQIEKEFSRNEIELDIDTSRLRRAVINIVDNACHAMVDDKRQVIDRGNSRLHIKTGGNEKRIEITITDTGIGMPEDTLKKIFEPLFSTRGFGVGLGMPTVKQIIEQHGGGIEIDTKEDEGTAVTLWLPISASKEDGKEVAA